MARTPTPISASEEEYESLLTWSRSQTIERRYVDRANVILLSLEGQTLAEIEASTGLSQGKVNKWRMRFREHGLSGLDDSPRPGRSRVISPDQRARVIQLASSAPGKGYTNWSQRRIAEHLGISQSAVSKILSQADLKPHKTDYWCGKSPDPEFEAKMLNIVGLYMNPPENALVLSVDEKTQIQALDRTQPELPLKAGLPRRLTTTYNRNGTVSLIASLAVHTGEINASAIQKNNAHSFLTFLKKLDRTYRNKHLHIIVDNLATHKNQEVKKWLEKKRKITIHFTPTYASWLNQIEIWFNILTKDVIKGGVWKSKQDLTRQIIQYIKEYNQNRAKPFNWTYTGKVLKK